MDEAADTIEDAAGDVDRAGAPEGYESGGRRARRGSVSARIRPPRDGRPGPAAGLRRSLRRDEGVELRELGPGEPRPRRARPEGRLGRASRASLAAWTRHCWSSWSARPARARSTGRPSRGAATGSARGPGVVGAAALRSRSETASPCSFRRAALRRICGRRRRPVSLPSSASVPTSSARSSTPIRRSWNRRISSSARSPWRSGATSPPPGRRPRSRTSASTPRTRAPAGTDCSTPSSRRWGPATGPSSISRRDVARSSNGSRHGSTARSSRRTPARAFSGGQGARWTSSASVRTSACSRATPAACPSATAPSRR